MLVDSKEFNNSNNFSKTEYYYNENKKYYNIKNKKDKNKKPSNILNENLLIDSLKDFSVKYEMDSNLISKENKFVITFDELISLIRFSLEAQIKLYNQLINEQEEINALSKDFINDLKNYIYSYEKVELVQNPFSKKNKKNNSNKENKENININENNVKSKKSLCNIISKSPSYLDEEKKILNNNNNQKKIKVETVNNNMNIKNRKNNFQGSKSYYRRNLGPKLLSPKKTNNDKFKDKIGKNENSKKNLLNKSVEKKHYTIHTNLSCKNINNYKKKNINNSAAKRKSIKVEQKKSSRKNLSIYTACQNLKSASFILNNKKEGLYSTENQQKKAEINDNYKSKKNIKNCKSKEKNVVYYDQNMIFDVRKQIIVGNFVKPSTFANKLLQNGRKYITEFNGIKEEEKKKQFL